MPKRKYSKLKLSDWADKKKLACFSLTENELKPSQIPIGSSKKCKFKCDKCDHIFHKSIYHITSRGQWCCYCFGGKLCGNSTCKNCFPRSLASWTDKKKLACFSSSKNILQPHQIHINSGKKYVFECDVCSHLFHLAPHKKKHWCNFCSGHRICGKIECIYCAKKSFAFWTNEKKLSCFSNKNKLIPRQIFLNARQKYIFNCNVCFHEFKMSPAHLTSNNNWCPYCYGRVCGETNCKLCAPACHVCKYTKRVVKAFHNTSDGQMCRSCFVSSPHAPVSTRAKISLEIYMFAEISRQAAKHAKHGYIWSECTAWDCAILPGLGYKPDNIWVFGKNGNIFSTSGACKINKNLVGHVIVLEILEVGIQQHSDARAVSDEKRESEIRNVFHPNPVDFLYVVVAAYNHASAHPDDQFFAKHEGSYEYKVVSKRKSAWQARIKVVLENLEKMYTEKSGNTVFIGN